MSFKSFISGTEPTTRPEKPTFFIRPNNVRYSLNPEHPSADRATSLVDSFMWGDTPQGGDFWAEEYTALQRGEELSDEAQEYLRSLIA